MLARTVSFSGLPPKFVISLPDQLFVDLVCSLEQKVREEVSWVVRRFLAQVDETFSQVRHNLVHQVLANRLRALIKQVPFVLADLLELLNVTFFSLCSVTFSVLLKDLFVRLFLFGFLVLDLFPLNHSLNLVDLTLRVLILFCLVSSEHLLFLLFSQIWVLHDIELSLRLLPIVSLALGCLSFTGFATGNPLDVLEEAVVVLSDQV